MEGTESTITFRLLGQASVNLEKVSGCRNPHFPEGRITGFYMHTASFGRSHFLLRRVRLRFKRIMNFLFLAQVPPNLFFFRM
jgi:hypothetical protein